MEKLYFASDYMEGAHPRLLEALTRTNMEHTTGYGEDEYCEAARENIRKACRCPGAEVRFLAGGTQANAVVIGACLRPWQGVIAAETGHVSVHEAGAIEAGGHKVLTLPQTDGKLRAADIRACAQAWRDDGNREHMVMPGMVYLSQPTELGTLYSLAELTAIHEVCEEFDLPLYVDGARLAYALACPENDAGLADLASLCDVFYIGGTKCGALLGEAVVIPREGLLPHFFTVIKQNGALLAKGRVLGVQFGALFEDGLYETIGAEAVALAGRIREALTQKGYELAFPSPTNQVFPVMNDAQLSALEGRVEYSFWERCPDGRTVIRFATSWATRAEDVERLIGLL